MAQRTRRIWTFVLIAIVVIGVAGIGFGMQSARVKQGSAEAIKTSKLLGVSLSKLQREFGKPSSTIQSMKNGTGMYMFNKGQVMVSFVESKSYQINYTFPNKGINLASAKAWVKKMIPTDSKLLRTRTGVNHQPVDVYQSNGLSGQFGQEVFNDANGLLHPGYFDVSYVVDKSSRVTEVDFAVGDNS